MDRVGRSVAAGLLTDNPDVAQGHRTYRGLREWIRAQVSDLRKTCPGGVRTALVEAGLALGPSSTLVRRRGAGQGSTDGSSDSTS